MSTPNILLGELDLLAQHHLESAARHSKLLTALRDQVSGAWVNVHSVTLEIGRVYFIRLKWAPGHFSAAGIARWESHGWVAEYGCTSGGGSSHSRLEVRVSAKDLASRKRGKA